LSSGAAVGKDANGANLIIKTASSMEGENVDSRNKLKLIHVCKLLADYDHKNNLVFAELT